MTDYFQVMGLELVYDPQDHFFRLTGQGAGSERFGETSTLLVLLMKLIYRTKSWDRG